MEKKLKVDLSQAPWVACNCSETSMIFSNRLMFKRVSPLISPTGQEEFVPIEIIVCDTCGKVPKFVTDRAKDIPEELRSKSPLIV